MYPHRTVVMLEMTGHGWTGHNFVPPLLANVTSFLQSVPYPWFSNSHIIFAHMNTEQEWLEKHIVWIAIGKVFVGWWMGHKYQLWDQNSRLKLGWRNFLNILYALLPAKDFLFHEQPFSCWVMAQNIHHLHSIQSSEVLYWYKPTIGRKFNYSH